MGIAMKASEVITTIRAAIESIDLSGIPAGTGATAFVGDLAVKSPTDDIDRRFELVTGGPYPEDVTGLHEWVMDVILVTAYRYAADPEGTAARVADDQIIVAQTLTGLGGQGDIVEITYQAGNPPQVYPAPGHVVVERRCTVRFYLS